jgi:hypothetical protein
MARDLSNRAEALRTLTRNMLDEGMPSGHVECILSFEHDISFREAGRLVAEEKAKLLAELREEQEKLSGEALN